MPSLKPNLLIAASRLRQQQQPRPGKSILTVGDQDSGRVAVAESIVPSHGHQSLDLGFPALNKGGHDKKLVGYFQGDTGTINQIVHLWKFDDDADRRKHWAAVFANKDFMEGFASKFRPLVMTQEVKLLTAAPWGPHP